MELFADVPESLDHTNEIIDKVEPIKLKSDLLLPYYNIPPGYDTMDDYLRHLAYEGAKKRYPDMSQEVRDRIDERRVNFLGQLPYGQFLKLLQVSAAHAYLTYPFVLSWSCLEAMSAWLPPRG